MEAKGFKQILAETKARCFNSFKDSSLKTTITYFIGSLSDSAETELLWLEIGDEDRNLKSIPSWIPLQNLHCLSVSGMEELWSTFQQQLQINTQASFELRNLKISSSPSLQNLPDLIGKCNHLEELNIVFSLENTDITSLIQSVQQLSNLRLLFLWGSGVSLSGNLDLSKGRDSTDFEASRSSRMDSLETLVFRCFDNISKLLISGEICPRLRSLNVQKMSNLNEMDLKQLERLNTVQVRGCPKLATISGLSSLTGLQVLSTQQCEGLKSLPTLAHLRRLKRIKIGQCHQLQSIEGLEELQGLECLQMEVPYNGDANMWSCIYGLRRLPSEYTILTGKPVDRAFSKLNVNLFSDVIDAEAVAEIDRGRIWGQNMSNSSSAITIYALIITADEDACILGLQPTNYYFPDEGKWVLTALFSTDDSNVGLHYCTIHKGFMATVNKGEEEKALTVLQRIVNRLYGY